MIAINVAVEGGQYTGPLNSALKYASIVIMLEIL